MTYKEKCLRIIELAYSDNFSEEELYKLLVDVCKSNALKKRIFADPQYYDGFSEFMAEGLYMRLVDKNKAPIRSISNYINTTLKGFFDEFAKIEFKQVIDTNLMEDGPEIRYSIDEMVKSQVLSQNDAFNEMYLEEYVRGIHKQIKRCLDEGGYSLNETQRKFVYISILLTMISGKEKMFRLDPYSTNIFSLVLTDVKSRVSRDILETLKSDCFLPDDINYILYNEEVSDE